MRLFDYCISVANSWSVWASFFEPFQFVASDHVTVLKNKSLSSFSYLFITQLTSRRAEKYNFNREINDKRISREKIILPVDEKWEIDYKFMENYMKYLMLKKYQKYLNY